MKNMSKLLQQAQQMQNKISVLQKELADREVEASSGGGMVKVKVNGKKEILEVLIDPECVDPSDVEMLQELVKTAVNQGIQEAEEMANNAMNKVTGGLNIPGLF
ncbi:MAG: YbaB/EbfC family nucleoid-associated protein [Halobacteriovoraceae bacterium]|nr:YbaB/EbfC family nucleoid-associated protein [Halobacteriovoraceae bacterium]